MTLEEQNLLDPVDITAETAEEATDEAIPENEIAEESFNEAEKTVNEEEESPEEEIEPSLPEVEDDIPDLTEILALRAELDSLKKELEENRAFYARLDGECAEFSSLYPDVSVTSLPDTVWQSVKKGVPLSAAYALEVRRAEVKAQKARQVNRDNSEMSSGALGNNNRNDFFSPAEVRAMSASEVRANYSKIIESMSKWH